MAYDDSDLRGVGGWLAFFIIVLAILTPIRVVIATAGIYSDPQIALAFGDRWWLAQAIELGLAAVNLLGAWYIAWRLNSVHVWQSVRIAIAGIWILAVPLTLVELIAVALLLGISVADIAAESAADLVRGLLFCLIWTAYLLKSRRVANTYGEDEGEVGEVFA
jgi:hypothetical protein